MLSRNLLSPTSGISRFSWLGESIKRQFLWPPAFCSSLWRCSAVSHQISRRLHKRYEQKREKQPVKNAWSIRIIWLIATARTKRGRWNYVWMLNVLKWIIYDITCKSKLATEEAISNLNYWLFSSLFATFITCSSICNWIHAEKATITQTLKKKTYIHTWAEKKSCLLKYSLLNAAKECIFINGYMICVNYLSWKKLQNQWINYYFSFHSSDDPDPDPEPNQTTTIESTPGKETKKKKSGQEWPALCDWIRRAGGPGIWELELGFDTVTWAFACAKVKGKGKTLEKITCIHMYTPL